MSNRDYMRTRALAKALRDLLGCCELNLDELDRYTRQCIRKANEILEKCPKIVDRSKRYLYRGYVIEYDWEQGDWVFYEKARGFVGALPTANTKCEAKQQIKALTSGVDKVQHNR